jgi:hypothetical protein
LFIFSIFTRVHSKKRRAGCSTGLNNVLLPTLFTLVNNIELNSIVEPESGVTILFNIVDNCEQCGQQSIVQSCFHQYCNNLSVFASTDFQSVEILSGRTSVDVGNRQVMMY